MRNAVIGALGLVIILWLIGAGIGLGVLYLALKLICGAFGWAFSWKLVIGIWLLFVIVTTRIKIEVNAD